MAAAPDISVDEVDESARPDHELVIIGSGFSGIGAAMELKRAGFHDFVILEKASDLGGTWRDHDYPGLTVDMPSFIYCYPREMSAEWSRVYAPGSEIKAYADHCARKHGLERHLRFDQTVREAVWDEAHCIWRIEIESGTSITARYLVGASGLLVEPKLPDIAGLDAFAGKLLHSARWDHGFDLSAKRVAVIGTGATAVQLVPAIVDRVAHLDVYQRTPIWLMAKPDAEIDARWQARFRRFPILQHLVRWAINAFVELTMGPGFVRYRKFPWMFQALERKLVADMRAQVDDPAVQEKLIPAYSFFCKRPSFSNEYYGCFNREHVELVTEPIECVTEHGIRTADGREHALDVIICATGYSVFDRSCAPNYELIGCNGLNLGDFWERERFQAYEGASVPGFPNFYLFMGPYSAAGASYFTMIDTQSRHLVRCLGEARRRGAKRVEVKPEAHARDFEKVKRRRKDMVLYAGNCAPSNSYYFDVHGDAPGLRPVTGLEHWLRSRLFSLRDYDFARR